MLKCVKLYMFVIFSFLCKHFCIVGINYCQIVKNLFSDKPDPPVSPPFVSNIRNTSLTLSWYGSGYDGGTPILSYRIEMKRDNEQDWHVLNDSCQVYKLQKTSSWGL